MNRGVHLSRTSWVVAVGLLISAGLLTVRAQQPAVPDPNRWEATIEKFEAQDRVSPPPKGEIVFTGASSIVRWNLPEYFPDLKVINRGFGGSEMADAARYASRIVAPYSPRIVVLYSGDNDIGRGVTPEKVQAGRARRTPPGADCRDRGEPEHSSVGRVRQHEEGQCADARVHRHAQGA